MLNPRSLWPLVLIPWLATAAGGPPIHHDLQVRLTPEQGRIEGRDRIRLPVPAQEVGLVLHAGLALRAEDPGITLKEAGTDPQRPGMARYRVLADGPRTDITLSFAGAIAHPIEETREGYTQGREDTLGRIGPEGAFLARSSGWFPDEGAPYLTFTLEVGLPQGWSAISQGRGDGAPPTARWAEDHPQEELYLIAGPLTGTTEAGASAERQVWLRRQDPELARTYLDAGGRYLDLYSRLIGPYPYAKFAVVENFWETGYGMPSFTLLGPKVLRLPFIPHTSLPHEVLHNWWGNGVYVDYRGGNWCEGLTAYLADHLLREAKGEGAAYRRDALQAYADYVAEHQEFPLTRFVGRSGEVSQAIGYGKAMMLFHMLRLELGDDAFIEGLRRLYREQGFRTTSWADLQRTFEAVAGRGLEDAFLPWLGRTGAPRLALGAATPGSGPNGPTLRLRIAQTQTEAPFPLHVPVLILLQGQAEPVRRVIPLSGREVDTTLELPAPAAAVHLDPGFDLFRRLAPGEAPPTLASLFGAERPLLVLPRGTPDALRDAYVDLARGWAAGQGDIETRWDDELKGLPEGRAIWVLGAENRWAGRAREALPPGPMRAFADRLETEDGAVPLDAAGFALAGRHQTPIGWLAAPSPAALARMAAKLPHYGKYGYLLFEREDARNRLKGQWPATDSALSRELAPGTPPLRSGSLEHASLAE